MKMESVKNHLLHKKTQARVPMLPEVHESQIQETHVSRSAFDAVTLAVILGVGACS